MKRTFFLGVMFWLFNIAICFPQMPAPIYESIEEAQIASAHGFQITRLDLTKQKLKTVPEEIKAYKDLVELRLDKNRIVAIPAWISELSKLELFSAERINLMNSHIGLKRKEKKWNYCNRIKKELKLR